jgi:flagellar biosynthesis anti-sigma factor FlgM
MRIDANRAAEPVRSVQGTTVRPLEGASALPNDSVTISAKAADIRLAMEALKQTCEVREAEVEALRAQVEQGTFEPDLEALAAKLVP